MINNLGTFLEHKYFYRSWVVFLIRKYHNTPRLNAIENNYFYVGSKHSLIEIELKHQLLLVVYSLDKDGEYRNCEFDLDNNTLHFENFGN